MSLEEFRSIWRGPVGAIASAIIGSSIVGSLMKKWSRWVPVKVNGMKRDELLRKHGSTILVAERLAAVGAVLGLVVMKALKNNDIRGLGLVMGLSSSLTIGWIVSVNLTSGTEAIKECMVAFAVFEKTPPRPLFGVIAFCIVGGVISAVTLAI